MIVCLEQKIYLMKKDPRVRAENTDVEFPLSLEYKKYYTRNVKTFKILSD